MNALVRRASWRYFSRHPWQLLLTIAGVALGVAVVVAVDLANESARRAFQLSSDSVLGRATHQIVGGSEGLDERIYTRLRVELGVRAAAPVVEAYGTVGNETLHLLGIDPFAESSFRAHVGSADPAAARRLLTEPNTVLAADVTAARLRLSVDERFRITLGGRTHELVLAGIIKTDSSSRTGLDGLLISDIATAQELTDYVERLSWIDLILPEGAASEAMRARIAAALPLEAELLPAAARTQALAQMTHAFSTNLSAMSLLALLVGMFLVYNAMTFAVLQRRRLIGLLRALGVTHAQIFGVVLAEGLVVGAVGGVLGLLAGVALGQGLVRLVTRTINDLYFVVTVSELLVTPAPLIKAFVLGLAATAAAVLAPAQEAAAAAPRFSLARSVLEARVRAAAPWLALFGLFLSAIALLLLWLPSRDLVFGFVALFLFILGLTLMAPLIVFVLATLPAPLATRLGTPARLALRGIGASLSRTGVAIAALLLAVAVTVGVGVMVASFRAAVATWLDTTLKADLYVTAPSLRSSRTTTHLDPELIRQLRKLPGVAALSTARRLTVESRAGLSEIFVLDAPPTLASRFPLTQGDPRQIYPAFFDGAAVLVSEPYAYHHAVAPGDRLALRTDRGMVDFRIAGVYRDYGSSQGEVAMHRQLYERYFDDPQVSSVGLYLTKNADLTATAVRALAGPGQEILVRSNRELRAASLDIFDRTFTITNVLRLLTVVAAFIGILSALLALSLERTRELGVLRALGFTPGQIRRLVLWQTGFMGLAAGVLALPVGTTLAALLVHVINRRAFGWSMELLFPPAVYLEALGLAVAAALIAGIYPAFRMAHAVPADILREE